MRKNSIRKAFTLAELLLGMSILVSALCAILYGLISCMLLNEANRNFTTAVTHAEYVMEEIKNATFENIQTNIAAGTWDWNSVTIAGKGLSVLNSESIDTNSSGTDPLDVTVSVSWQDRNLRNRSTYLETLFSG